MESDYEGSSFNNIDPEVDTESFLFLVRPIGDGGVSTISIQKWILKEISNTGRDFVKVTVSTISIQKWILKVRWVSGSGWQTVCFNNIDPEVDTESTKGVYVRHVYSCFNNIDPEVDTESSNQMQFWWPAARVSTISIQKWILKDEHVHDPQTRRESFNNIDPEVDTESEELPGRRGADASSFNNIDPEVDTERRGTHHVPFRLRRFNNIDPEVDTESWDSLCLLAFRWTVSTISIQKWILKDLASDTRAWETLVSTISIQKWILKEDGNAALQLQFALFQQYRSRSGYWKWWSPCELQEKSFVSTISIQKWILKDIIRLASRRLIISFQQYRSSSGYWKITWIMNMLPASRCFNNIDPEVDTERHLTSSRNGGTRSFQQYRSRSGYWKLTCVKTENSALVVSTISIQKWILKVCCRLLSCSHRNCFNNIDPEVDTER